MTYAERQEQRERILRALLRELDVARVRRDDWYVWVTEEWPRIKAAKQSRGQLRGS